MYYAVIGRIPSHDTESFRWVSEQDEDGVYMFQSDDRHPTNLHKRFIEAIYAHANRHDQAEVEATHGTPVHITAILVSESPIEFTS